MASPPENEKQEHPSPEEISDQIASFFPKLDRSDIGQIAQGFEGLNEKNIDTILTPTTGLLPKGRRTLRSYLRAAPVIYGLIGQEGFHEWVLLTKRSSDLSRSCFEGFFDSSIPIVNNGGIPLLKKWTELGMGLAKKNNGLAIPYFKFTSKVVISTEFDHFEELVEKGAGFARSNIRVAEAYLEHLSDMLSVLSSENLDLFCSLIAHIQDIDWTVAVKIINRAKDVLSAIPPQRRETLLKLLDENGDIDESYLLAMFNNSPLAIAHLADPDLKVWATTAREISKVNEKVAVSFIEKSQRVLGNIDIDELSQWAWKGTCLLSSNWQAAKTFFESSFESLGYELRTTDREEREFLLDTGIRLAHVNHECVESYFKNATLNLKSLPKERFNEWIGIGEDISKQSSFLGSSYYRNSTLALVKLDPQYHEELFSTGQELLKKSRLIAGAFFENLPKAIEDIYPQDIGKWAAIGFKVYDEDEKIALDYFSHSPQILNDLDISELEEWALKGIEIFKENGFRGRSYFSLRSRTSRDIIEKVMGGVSLKRVQNILKYYAIGLSNINFRIRSKNMLAFDTDPDSITPVISGNTIYLAPKIKKYTTFEDNFKLYKLSIIHEVGHAQFTTSRFAFKEASLLLKRIVEKYNTNIPETSPESTLDLAKVIEMLPNKLLAADIIGLLEDARIEHRIMESYKGLSSELERLRHQMLLTRPGIKDRLEGAMESLIWLSVGYSPESGTNKELDDLAHHFRSLLQKSIFQPDSSTLNCLEATFEIYNILENNFGPLELRKYEPLRNLEYRGVGIDAIVKNSTDADPCEHTIERFIPEYEIDQPYENTSLPQFKKQSYAEKKNWKVRKSYRYDEWDTIINDYRSDWCVVNEIEPVGKSSEYYQNAIERYNKEISQIRRIFKMMRPQIFTKLKRQTDGDEIDIDAFIDALIERRCGINPDDRLYIKKDKRERDVATLLLVDVSVSTKKRLGESSSIIDVEKDALIVMVQALESINDKYAIYAFSGQSRKDVEYYAIKEFDEELSEDVARRISLLEPVANTRLGPAIRHSISKLEQVEAKTKIIVLLSDGEPYDTCIGERPYEGHFAEEDTRVAIQEGNSRNIHFFCITVDKDPEQYLDAIFSDVGYTIIDDAQILPERLPLLYKRITS